MAGSSLIPLHYVEQKGANYMMSYAMGAAIANLLIWMIYYAVLVIRLPHQRHPEQVSLSWNKKLRQAAGSMPEWHVQQLWKPGLCAGMYHVYRSYFIMVESV